MTYAYTKLGLVRSAAETGHGGPTVYDYTAHGEQTVMAEPMGTATHNAYDANGRLVRTVNAHGRLSLRTYDDAGNLTSLSQPTGAGAQLVTTYTHTRRNEIATESDPADAAHTISYDYDGEGRQKVRRDLYNGALQRSTDQTWRSDGRLTERDARFAGTETRRHRSTWSYDAAGNPTAMATYADGATSPNVSSVTAAYTSANELKAWDETIYNPSGAGITKSSSFAYDQNGLVTRRTVDGKATSYTYDRRGLETTTHAFGAQAPFTSAYHPSGALATKALPNGASWSLAYDLADRVASRVLRSSAGAVLSGWENLAYDDNDSKLTEHYTQRQLDGTTKDGDGHYSYDKLNRLTTSKHPLEPLVVPYALDDAGNVVTETGFVYTYAANRLTKRERFPQIDDYSTYDYDRFGNQTQENVPGNVAATNTYDAASHSVTRNQGGFNISQTYDALDRMVRRSDSTGDVTLFFHDGPGQAIAFETDGNGATKTTYTLDAKGEALLKDDNAVAFPSGRAYYVTDSRGSLTQLLDGAQNVTAVFAYDDFGKQKDALTQTSANGSSTWDSRLRFQLAPKDGITGQYAIGPRMLDPGTYRFIGADQFVGSGANQELQQDPLTGNRYLYAGSNPANLIDDGHAPRRPRRRSRSGESSCAAARKRTIGPVQCPGAAARYDGEYSLEALPNGRNLNWRNVGGRYGKGTRENDPVILYPLPMQYIRTYKFAFQRQEAAWFEDGVLYVAQQHLEVGTFSDECEIGVPEGPGPNLCGGFNPFGTRETKYRKRKGAVRVRYKYVGHQPAFVNPKLFEE